MPDWVDSIQRAFERNRAAVPEFWAAVAVLVVLLVIARLWVWRSAVRARINALKTTAATRGLTPDDVETLVALARHVAIDPMRLFESLTAFEHATAKALEAKALEAARIHDLRRALGFDHPARWAPIVSSRELEVGMHVTLAGIDGVVSSVDEEELGVSLLRPMRWATIGSEVELSLTHGREAQYRLRCIVRSMSQKAGRFETRLAHDERPQRLQARAHARVLVDSPVTLKPAPSRTAPAILRGHLVDISGGGALVRVPQSIPVGQHVDTSFSVGQTPFPHVDAVVLKAVAHEDGCEMHLKFAALSERERDKLVGSLMRLELQKEARLAS